MARNFDGTGDYILATTLGDMGSVGFESPFTFSFWLKMTDTGQGCVSGTFNTGGNTGFQLLTNSDQDALNVQDKLYMFIRADGGGALTGANTTATTYTDGNWHHFNVFFDDANNTIKLHLDGT